MPELNTQASCNLVINRPLATSSKSFGEKAAPVLIPHVDFVIRDTWTDIKHRNENHTPHASSLMLRLLINLLLYIIH